MGIVDDLSLRVRRYKFERSNGTNMVYRFHMAYVPDPRRDFFLTGNHHLPLATLTRPVDILSSSELDSVYSKNSQDEPYPYKGMSMDGLFRLVDILDKSIAIYVHGDCCVQSSGIEIPKLADINNEYMSEYVDNLRDQINKSRETKPRPREMVIGGYDGLIT